MERKSIKVVSWNCRSHDRRRTVMEKLVTSNRVVMLQETKRKNRPEYDEEDSTLFSSLAWREEKRKGAF
jgi:hypothetical protein